MVRLVVEAAPSAMILVNPEGKITLVNARVEAVFGYARQELIGQSIEMLVPERFRSHHSDHRNGFFADPKVRTLGTGRDLFGLRKDGSDVPVEIGLNPINVSGKLFVLASIIDITERKLAQEQVRRNLERIRALHETDTAISSTLDLRSVLNILLEKIELFLPIAAATTVSLLNRETGERESLACHGLDEEEWRSQQPTTLGGRAKRIFETKAPVTLRNVLSNAEIYNPEIYRKHGLVSYLGVPLIAKDEVLGVLGLYTKQEHEFSKEEIDFLLTLGNQAAIAINNARFYEETQRNLERVRAMYELNVALTSGLDLTGRLELLLEKISSFLPNSSCAVRLINKKSERLETVMSKNLDVTGWHEQNIHSLRGHAKAVLEDRKPLAVLNLQTDPQTFDPDFFTKNGLISMLALPLIAQEEVLGSLIIYTTKEHSFTDEEVHFFATLTGQAAIAIYNAQLYKSVESSKKELELANQYLERSLKQLSGLYTALSPLAAAQSVPEMMDRIIERLLEATGADTAMIRIQDKVSGSLSIASQRGFPDYLVRRIDTEPLGPADDLVFSTGDIIIAPDIDKEPRLTRKVPHQFGLRSCAMLPLKVHDQVRGIIHLASRKLGYFDEEQKDHLIAIARQMGIALENRELFDNLRASKEELEALQDETQSRAKNLETLAELSRVISSSLNIQDVFDFIVRSAARLFSAKAVRLWVEEPARGGYVIKASHGIDPSVIMLQQSLISSVQPGQGYVGQIVMTKAADYILDMREDPRSLNPGGARSVGVVSYAGIPILRGDQLLGVLTVMTGHIHEFTDQEKVLMKSFADQAAVAINNAQLYEKIDLSRRELELSNLYLGKSLKQLSGLYTALSPLTASESVTEMMDGIIDRLMEATGTDAALIRLRDEKTDTYPLASHRGFHDHYLKSVGPMLPGGAVDWVYKNREPIIAPDIALEPRFKGKIQLKLGFLSCTILPLKVHDEVRGIIHLASRKLGYFDEEQRDHLLAIARQMGIALENRELFAHLRASKEELERAIKVKDEFLSVMSHELRTPLNVVMGYAGMMKDGMLGAINPQQDEALGKVIARANDQLALVNNILYATVLESEKINVDVREFVLGDFLNQLKSAYDIPTKKLPIHWECAEPLAPIRTDDAKFKLILQNLIDNALKFTSRGEVKISARVIELSALSSQPSANSQEEPEKRDLLTQTSQSAPYTYVEFKVADTGVGIPKDQLPLIFERFHQVDSTETRLFGGVGMGLYIVKQFTELLGGTVEVESEPEKGSTFTVTIPSKN